MWGGGALTETVLWTNPSPTSTFSGTECSLSSTLDNGYKYIKVTYRASTTDATEYEVYFDAQSFINNGTLDQAGQYLPAISTTIQVSSNYFQTVRCMRKGSNTSINVTQCYRLGQTTAYNNYAIPTKISGLK